MKTLRIYLWKEWRDHRSVLIGMFVAVPLLMAVAGLSLPSKAFEGREFAVMTALACLAIWVFALTTDLVPGEVRRGTIGFLARMPTGLRDAFRAKLILFALGGFFFTAYGFLNGAVASAWVYGRFPTLPLHESQWILAIVAVWVFAVSCCLPRGVLAVPATAALAVLLALPVVLIVVRSEMLPSQVTEWSSTATILWWLAGGLLAARFAFVRARRHGGAGLAAGRWCLAITAVCGLPFWADASISCYDWFRSRTPVVCEAFVDPGGCYLYVNVWDRYERKDRRGAHIQKPRAPVIVDLEGGTIRAVETDGWAQFGTVEMVDRGGWWSATAVPNETAVLQEEAFWYRFVDCTTGRVLGPVDRERDEERIRAAKRTAASLRLPDGRRVWSLNGAFECDAPGGGVEQLGIACNAYGSCSFPCGSGISWSRVAYHDFARRKSYRRRDLALESHDILIRSGRWLVWKKAHPKKYLGKVWELFDPDTGARSPARGLDPHDTMCAVLDDGRLLVLKREKRLGEATGIVLLDPETGESRAVAMPDGLARHCRVANAGRWNVTPVRTPSGQRVFVVCGGELVPTPYGTTYPQTNSWLLARLDEGEGRLVGAGPVSDRQLWLVGCLDNDEAFVIADQKEIWRVRFGSDAHEVVYRAGDE